MAVFEKKTEFHAYKYIPGSVPQDELRSHISYELNVPFAKIVSATEESNVLFLTYLISGEESVATVRPGQWVKVSDNEIGILYVQEDVHFQEFLNRVHKA